MRSTRGTDTLADAARMHSVVRELTDAAGLRWTVRRFLPTLGPALGPAFGAQPMSDQGLPGWLTFECEPTGWLRRLTPVPADWETCDEPTLRGYLEAARHVPRRRKGPLP